MLVVVLVLLTGGSDSPLIGGATTPPTPPFTFEMVKTVAVTTDPDANSATQKKADAVAKPIAAATGHQLHDFYSEAFLVPGNWMSGGWDDEVFAMFSNGARDEATAQTDVLTAGPEAGAAFSTITPQASTLKTKVLMDPKGKPTSVVGIVYFTAKGAEKDGQGAVAIVSKGQYIFQKVDGEWKVVSFSVSRHDKLKKGTPASGSVGSTAPSAEAS